MRKKILWLSALLIVAVSACGSSAALKGVSGDQLPVIDIGADTLTQVTSPSAAGDFVPKAAAGHLLVLYLGYTNCPDICPTTMSDIRTARQSLSASQQARVNVAFVTVDQVNDTPQVLLDYTKRFSFTGSDYAIRPTDIQLSTAEKTLFASAQSGPKTASGIQTVNHTAFTYVVNSKGDVVDEWDYGFPSKDMAHDMKILLNKA